MKGDGSSNQRTRGAPGRGVVDMATVESERETSERPGIWQLAFPSILGNLLFSVVGLVQTKVVGELGAQALAAVGAGQRIFFALMAVMMAISAGTVALVARAWGAGDSEEAGRVTVASLMIACGFGLVLTVVGVIFAGPVASIFGLDDDTVEMAARNIRWLSIFNVVFAVNFILSSALRAAGDAWTPLYIGVGVNLINIPLLYVFVFGLYGAPAMGVAGAAVAAGIAFSLGAIVMLLLWVGQRLRIGYFPDGWSKKARLKRLFDIGYPAGVEQVVFQAGFFVFLMIIGRFYGTEAFAAYNIGVNLLSVCMVVGFGFSIAGSTLVGQHLGADDPVGAARAGWRSGGMSALSMGVLGVIVIIFASELAGFILGDEPLTIQYTVEFTWILGAAMPLLGIEFAIGGALRGAGDTRFPLMATFFGLIGVRCGLAALATLFGLPVFWVYASLAGDYLLKGAMLTWRFHSGRWKSVVRNEDLSYT